MKILFKVSYIICLVILFLLIIGGLITGQTYNHVFFVGPIFFNEIFIFSIVYVLVVRIYFEVRNPESNRIQNFLLLFSFSKLSFCLAYLSHTQIKMEILFQRIIDHKYDEDDYNEVKELYESNNDSESFELLEMKIKMFREIYQLQYDYLKESNRLGNPTFYVQFFFFLILGTILLGNGFFLLIYEKSQPK